MKTVLIITSRFPFLPGEQFLEAEIKIWAEYSNVNLIIIPLSGRLNLKCQRSLPDNSSLFITSQSISSFRRAWGIGACLLRFSWIKEIFNLAVKGKTSFKSLRNVLVSTYLLADAEVKLKEFIGSRSVTPDIVYSYWQNYGAYAAVNIFSPMNIPVVSRLHGGDLYEERAPSGYMPYKRSYINKFDENFFLSADALDYAEKTYGMLKRFGSVSKLGITIDEVSSISARNFNTITLLSISSCIPLKRVSFIVDVVSMLSIISDKQINWYHIGDGPLYEEVSNYATERLKQQPNIDFKFMGSLVNSQVREFLSHLEIDCFINCSLFEGVPVSIMEAMSYGVPVVAPNVGSVRALVNSDVGKLMDASSRPVEYAKAILETARQNESGLLSVKCRARVIEQYDADKNFRDFIERLLNKMFA